jgi:beta-lactamase class D
MIKYLKPFVLFIPIGLLLAGCESKSLTEIRPEFASYFNEYKVDGCFLLYDFNKNKTIVYNKERCSIGFLPASTFKMVNTLIGLETEIITGEEFIIPWDSVSRQIPAWNRDHNLASAFRNSVVPWYQELARLIGTEKMQHFTAKANFGNMDVHEDNLDLFWLSGNSRITPLQQLEFQKLLIQNNLPFEQKNIDLLKKIMMLDQRQEYTLRGKTGWAVMQNKNIGWLVGYLETDSNRYAYVINVESGDEDVSLFGKSRLNIVRKIFKTLSLI